MTVTLTSKWLSFDLQLPSGKWDLQATEPRGLGIAGALMSGSWRRDGAKCLWAGDMPQAKVSGPATLAGHLGPCQQADIEWTLEGRGVKLGMQCALSMQEPLFLWRLTLTNTGSTSLLLDRLEHLSVGWKREGSAREPGAMRFPRPTAPADLAFFSNGWQSWGYTGAMGPSDRFPRTRLGRFTRPMRVNAGTPQPRRPGHFASDMFGILGERKWRTALLVGFLSQRQAFGSMEALLDRPEPCLRMWSNGDALRLDAGESFSTDWACIQIVDLETEDPLDPYLEAVGGENAARTQMAVPVGWCSWYQFFERVTEEDIAANLAWAAAHRGAVPLELIQLDDGFEADVGDWFETATTFPSGLQDVSRKVRQAGFRPGLWLAPFIVKPKARVVGNHPEWLLRDRRGQPVNAGFIWNTFTLALDVTHPMVLEQSQELIHKAVREWGFDYLKLDFLYAGALPGERHQPNLTRAQALHRALAGLREAAGDGTTMIGCGCPIGSGVGIFDAMRIGADVAPRWHPAFLGTEFFFRHEPDFPAARNALRNTLTRSFMHRKWWVNDPDCLLMRSGDTLLTEAEVQAIATVVALSGGSLLVSDHLPALDADRQRWLARLLPPLPRAARVLDWFDARSPSRLLLSLSGAVGDWHLVAWLNWSDRASSCCLDLGGFGLAQGGAFHLVDFWRGAYQRLESAELEVPEVPAHGMILMAIRPAGRVPCWVGDTLHISQGLAVRDWKPADGRLSAMLDLGRMAEGSAWVALPSAPTSATLGPEPLVWKEAGAGVYRFDLTFSGRQNLQIAWH